NIGTFSSTYLTTSSNTVNIVGASTVLQMDGTTVIDASRNLTNIGTTEFNGITYTWPGTQTAGYVLQTDGDGTLSWVNTATDAFGLFNLDNGLIYPKNTTVDFALGGTSTDSALFAITGVNDGTPVASLSASTTGNGLSLTASTATIQ